jgi:hypothetical protein
MNKSVATTLTQFTMVEVALVVVTSSLSHPMDFGLPMSEMPSG